ncbi:MAG TPA: ATP-binding protein [Micropepsaceae bacterium]|nr:ATP-binding protein [Micropepsaceae bacterium]
MPLKTARTLFAAMASVLGCAAAIDVFWHGRFTLIDPRLFIAFTAVGAAYLLLRLYANRDKARGLESRTGKLEGLVAAHETANSRLNASEARYKGLVDAQGDAILRRTPEGRVTYANDALLKLFGFKSDALIGQAFRPEPHPDSPLMSLGQLMGREIGRERVSYDQHLKTTVGYRWIAWEDYAIRDAKGQLVEVQSVGRDITQRKTLEAAITIARDKAEDANRAKSNFLATMSHEIRTPMNGVLGMARLLLETPLAPDQKTYAEAICQSGNSLLALIEDILDFSKIESGALALEKGDVALRPLIEGIAELLSTRAHAKGIEIACAIAPEVPETVRIDGIRLRQVLTNLVGNAVKFTEQGGVLIMAEIEDGEDQETVLAFSVRDTGIGVPPEKQGEIFKDFVQADSSHARRFEGTGLGLAISKRLAEAMGGRIGVDSEPGRGSEFWVKLPLEAVAAAAPPPSMLMGKRVATLSASFMLREGLKRQLAATGAEMAAARDIVSLLAAAKDSDIAIIDFALGDPDSLPDFDALAVPAVALLPPSRRAHLPQLLKKGVRGYLMKPVRQASLEQCLSAVLGGAAPLGSIEIQARETPHHASALSILVAEDNAVNALLARELLRRRGHRVEQVTNGEAAVLACAARKFDLVMMDLHMPRLGGIEAARRIRHDELVKGKDPVAIFALTADALETGKKACLDAGMDGFLTKPVDPAELDAVLLTVAKPATVAA